MSQIFISHVNVDQQVAIKIATGFEEVGYTTWYYERDSLPGPSYIDQISDAIDNCQTMMILFSPTSVVAPEVVKEIEQAYLQRKPIIPVLLDITHKEVHSYKKLSQMLGTATDINVPPNGVDAVFVRRLVAGLAHMGIAAEKALVIEDDADITSLEDDHRGEIYRQALIEALSDGQINADDQSKLDYMARMLQLSQEQMTRYYAEVTERYQEDKISEVPADETESASQSTEDSHFELSRTEIDIPDVESNEESAAETFEIPADGENGSLSIVSEEMLLEEKWKLSLENSQTQILNISGDGKNIYRMDADGVLAIFDLKRNLCYQEHFSVPIYSVLAVENGLVLGDWEGRVFVYKHDQMVWQAYLNSPISSLASMGDTLVLGCWNGMISVRKLSDGAETSQMHLTDAVSALYLCESEGFVAGDLAGNVSVFNGQIQKIWSKQFASAVVQAELIGQKWDQVLVLLKDDQLININLNDQTINWKHRFDLLSQRKFDLSSSRKQIAFINDQQFNIFRLGRDLKLVSAQKLPEGIDGVFLPMLQDGRFIGLHTTEGLDVADLYRSQIYPIYKGNLARWCASANGRQLVVADQDDLTLFSLAKPELAVKLTPVTVLYQNRFSRLRIQINNNGKRLARQIRVELAGAVKCTPYTHETDLLPGEQVITEDYSVNISDEGAIPVKVEVVFEDDFGIEYSSLMDCILDVQAH